MGNSADSTEVSSRKVITAAPELSNREFLEKYGKGGCVGLACGTSIIDRSIARAERHISEEKNWGQWTHAFLFSEKRADGHLWIVESDLELYKKHIRLGVQENRCNKYEDQATYSSLAVLDFGLTEELTRRIVVEALELVASRTRYSLRELIGTLIALKRPVLRQQTNLLARDHCFYCSAFVQYLFQKVGVDLSPGLNVKNTTPEDIARSPHPHTAYVLQREVLGSRLREKAARLKRRARIHWRAAKRGLSL